MTAIRHMHLGPRVRVADEATSPALGHGDGSIAVSDSGSTAPVIGATIIAKEVGASALTVTASADSQLARNADVVLILPAADKQNRSTAITKSIRRQPVRGVGSTRLRRFVPNALEQSQSDRRATLVPPHQHQLTQATTPEYR